MNESFVSVIVPAYNSERTIRRCVDSLLNLDFQNYYFPDLDFVGSAGFVGFADSADSADSAGFVGFADSADSAGSVGSADSADSVAASFALFAFGLPLKDCI